MSDIITLQNEVNLFGDVIADKRSKAEREPFALALHAQLQKFSLEDFARCFTNPFEAVIDYVDLCQGQNTGQRISLLFNPHRLDTGTKRFPISLYQALKNEKFVSGLVRVIYINKKKGANRDLFYASIGMGVEGTSYVQEFPPHVARDLALEYGLTKSSRVLDPCAGWGGRMLGFSAVVDSYTCCEPSTRTAAGLRQIQQFIHNFRSDFTAEIHEAPFEDVQLQNGAYDFAMTSPPYYDTEWYAPNESANSFNRYATFEAWCDGFYAPLIHRTMAALKPGGCFVINIGSRLYPLNDQLFSICKDHYAVERQKGRLSASNGLGKSGEGETFYEIRRASTAEIVLLDATTLSVPSRDTQPVKILTPAVAETLSASETREPLTEDKPSALDFVRTLRDADAKTRVSETTVEWPITSESDDPAQDEDTANLQVIPSTPAALMAALTARGCTVFTHAGRLFVTNTLRLDEHERVLLKQWKAELLAIAPSHTPPPPAVTTTLAQFLNTEPLRAAPTWYAEPPPALDGIDEIVVNFATNGLDWAHGHRPVGVTVSTLDGQLTRFLPFAFEGGGNLDEAAVKEWALRELRGKKIYNANTKFDLHMARVWGVNLEAQGCTFSDIQHTAALIDDHRRQFKLDLLAKDFLNGVEVPRLDETRHHEYAAHDVAAREIYTAQLVGRLREKLYPELDKQDLRRVQDLEDQIIPCVVEMEKNGAPIDRALLKQWCTETEQRYNEYLARIMKEVRFPFSPDSSADWARLFEHFHIPVTSMTEAGNASFTDKILKHIDHPFVQLGRQAGKLASLRSKFLVAYDQVVGDDCLLRYQLHQLRGDDYGTVRGRFSASDKNIEQVMNHDTHLSSFGTEDYFVRRLFIADTSSNPNALFLSIDAAQIEFRLFVHYSESERLIQEYRKNPEVSFHRIAEALVKPFRADMPYTKIKSLNFLCLYGGGKTHMSDYLELPQDVSNQFYDIYHRAFPEVRALSRKAEQLAKSRGYVRSILGRRARFPDPKFAYKALNAVIQPTAADIFKTKIVELHRERKWTGFTMRAPNHDEVIGDAFDVESANRVKEILNRQTFTQLKVPILWSGKPGPNWAACK